ncbi:antibiotic biosynthesis monooxygenase family protein [Gracilimonas sp. Q87]|uniref:antibiotic biosynthesis monooxygenase family protein n=1 Tax=Gracilimonas sp. Q87 TaxID=3384766 RepID=UPI00398431DC
MEFTAISRFEVKNNMEAKVRKAFKNRPGFVENADGFVGLNVLSPQGSPAGFWLINQRQDEESFNHRHKHHRSESHQFIPKGLKLVKRSFKVEFFDHITS